MNLRQGLDNLSAIERLRAETTPLPGRPGQRIDSRGRVWYSDAFLGMPELDEPYEPERSVQR